jgi:hypothetical protein
MVRNKEGFVLNQGSTPSAAVGRPPEDDVAHGQ